MNGWDVVILVLVGAMVFFAARAWRRGGRKNGSCCGGCSGCAVQNCPHCREQSREEDSPPT